MGVLIVVTRLQADGLRSLRKVATLSGEVVADLRTRPGYRGGRLLLDRRKAAWTMTGWVDRAALEDFRTAHGPMAARIDEVATAADTTAWVAELLPPWTEVGSRWPAVLAPARGFRREVPAGLGEAAVPGQVSGAEPGGAS